MARKNLKQASQGIKPSAIPGILQLYASCELEFAGIVEDPALKMSKDTPKLGHCLTQYLLFTYFDPRIVYLDKIKVIVSNLSLVREVFKSPRLSITQLLIELESYGLGSLFERYPWWSVKLAKNYPYSPLL